MTSTDIVRWTERIPAAGVVSTRTSACRIAAGSVLFAPGGGSGRHSPRNRYVADVLSRAGLGRRGRPALTASAARAGACLS